VLASLSGLVGVEEVFGENLGVATKSVPHDAYPNQQHSIKAVILCCLPVVSSSSATSIISYRKLPPGLLSGATYHID